MPNLLINEAFFSFAPLMNISMRFFRIFIARVIRLIWPLLAFDRYRNRFSATLRSFRETEQENYFDFLLNKFPFFSKSVGSIQGEA